MLGLFIRLCLLVSQRDVFNSTHVTQLDASNLTGVEINLIGFMLSCILDEVSDDIYCLLEDRKNMDMGLEGTGVRLPQGIFLFGLGLHQQCPHKEEILQGQVRAAGLNRWKM